MAKPCPKVIPVLLRTRIQAVIAVARILISIRVAIIVAPAILLVCVPCPEALFIAVVYGLPEQISTVLIDLVVPTATIVPIARSCIEVGIAIVSIVAFIPQTLVLFAQVFLILLL